MLHTTFPPLITTLQVLFILYKAIETINKAITLLAYMASITVLVVALRLGFLLAPKYGNPASDENIRVVLPGFTVPTDLEVFVAIVVAGFLEVRSVSVAEEKGKGRCWCFLCRRIRQLGE
jgi:hypothetical protein